MLKFWEFSNFLENSQFFAPTYLVSLLGAILSLGRYLAERSDEDVNVPQKRTLFTASNFRFPGGHFGWGGPNKRSYRFPKTHLLGILSLRGRRCPQHHHRPVGIYLRIKRPILARCDFGERVSPNYTY